MDTDADPNQAARPILAAVDFSRSSEAALRWAASESRTHRVPLIVLHVVHDPVDAPGFYRKFRSARGGPPADDARSETMERIGERYLREFLDECVARDDDLQALGAIETRLVVGLPETRILEVAAACNARLIVMGSRGQTGLKHLLVGSKAERVVQLSPIPVTIVKAPPIDKSAAAKDATP